MPVFSFSSGAKAITALFSATALSQLLALAVLPVLTRQLGPVEMGYWGSFSACLALLLPVAALALPQAIVLANSDAKAKALTTLSFTLVVMFSCLMLLLYAVVASATPDLLADGYTASAVSFLAVALISAVAVQTAQQWFIRQQKFTILAKADFYQALVLNLSKLALVLVWPFATLLMLLQAILPLTQFIQLKGWQLFGSIKKKHMTTELIASGAASQLSVRALLNEFRDFPLYQSPQLLLNAAAQALPVFVLASVFGVASAGFYTLAKTVLLAPASWANKAIADFLYPAFSALQRQRVPLSPLFFRSTLILSLVGLVPVLALFYLAPPLFMLLFGKEWLPAAEMAQWLCPWLYCFIVNPPSVKMVMVLRLQAIALVLNMLTLLGRGCALWYGASYLQSVEVSILSFSLIGVVHNVLFVALAYWGCCRADRLLAASETVDQSVTK